jgi:siroheme synthase-like protein
VVGGGRIGTRKVLALTGAGARVTVRSPALTPTLARLARRGDLRWIRAVHRPGRLAAFRLVVAATDNPALNLRIGREAERRRLLFCSVKPGRASRAIFPAVFRVGGLTVAIHSDGRDCAASKRARDAIAAVLTRMPSRSRGKPTRPRP